MSSLISSNATATPSIKTHPQLSKSFKAAILSRLKMQPLSAVRDLLVEPSALNPSEPQNNLRIATLSGGSKKGRDSASASRAMSANRIPKPTLIVLLCLVLGLAIALRLYDLGAESYSYDEGIMIEATSSGWDVVVANITRGRPPLIVLLGFGWTSLFGESEFMVRLLPALMGIASIALLFRMGQKLLGDWGGLVAAAIMTISSFHLFHSQDYRYYSLLTLTTLLSFTFYRICFFERLNLDGALKHDGNLGDEPGGVSPERTSQSVSHDGQPTWGQLGLYVLFSGAVYYAHYQGVFVLVAQGLFFLLMWFRATNPLRWRWFLSQLILGLLLVPSVLRVLFDMLAGSQDGDFQGTVGALGNLGPLSDPPIWLPFHTLFIKFYFISIANLFELPYMPIAVGLVILGLVLGMRRFFARQGTISHRFADVGNQLLSYRFSLGLLLLWVLCPIFIPFGLSKLLSPMYLPRYTISALPAACLLLAFGLVAVRRYLPLWSSLGALLIISLPGLLGYYTKDYKDQWRIAAHYVEAQIIEEPVAEDADTALTSNGVQLAYVSINNETADRIQLLFNRYLSSGLADQPMQGSTEQECVISAGLATPEQLTNDANACFDGNQQVWMVTRTAKEGPQQQVEERLLSSIPHEWTQASEERFSGVVVRLYERSTN